MECFYLKCLVGCSPNVYVRKTLKSNIIPIMFVFRLLKHLKMEENIWKKHEHIFSWIPSFYGINLKKTTTNKQFSSWDETKFTIPKCWLDLLKNSSAWEDTFFI